MSESKRCKKKETRKLERRHTCARCSAAFSFPNKLRNHIKSSHSLSHACEHCDARFDRFNELRTHTAFAHHTRYKCHLCAYSSSVKAELKKHIVVNHENGVCCTIDGCNITIAYRMLKKHIREIHCLKDGNILHQASALPSAADNGSASSANDVLEVASPESLRQNTDAGFAEETPALPEAVVIQECAIETNDAPSTSTESSSDSRLRNNMVAISEDCESVPSPSSSSNSGAESLACSEDGCFKRFRRMRDLKRHRLRVHNLLTATEEAEFKFVCNYSNCRQRFPSAGRLRQHAATHGDGLLVKCVSCKKSFKNRATFAVHLRKYHLLSVRDVNYSSLFVSVTKSAEALVEGAA